jgi:ribonuclease VapC
MILDTSVLIVILQRQPGWEGLLDPDGVAVDADLARRALALDQRFGKGLGHAAQLNFGDCFAAALAEREPLPLAYAGGDFAAAGF